jgi:hypothetical protein
VQNQAGTASVARIEVGSLRSESSSIASRFVGSIERERLALAVAMNRASERREVLPAIDCREGRDAAEYQRNYEAGGGGDEAGNGIELSCLHREKNGDEHNQHRE